MNTPAIIEIEERPLEVLFKIRVNGKLIAEVHTRFIAERYRDIIAEAFLVVGVGVELK